MLSESLKLKYNKQTNEIYDFLSRCATPPQRTVLAYIIVGLVLIPSIDTAHAFLTGYSHRKKITVQSANVDADLTGFPVYIKINGDTDIGGNMQDSVNYYDIRFTDSLDNVLPYEEESMAIIGGSATGHYWVQEDIDDTAGATIYVYYGKAGDTDGSNAAGVWDANFKAVYHLNETATDEASTANLHQDSTTNNNDGDQEGNDDIVGKIANGQDFDGTDDYVGVTANIVPLGSKTISAWVNPSSGWSTEDGYVVTNYFSGATNGYSILVNVSGKTVGISWKGTINDVRTTDSLTTDAWTYLTAVFEAGATGGENLL